MLAVEAPSQVEQKPDGFDHQLAYFDLARTVAFDGIALSVLTESCSSVIEGPDSGSDIASDAAMS